VADILGARDYAGCDAVPAPWLLFSRGNMTMDPVGNVRYSLQWRSQVDSYAPPRPHIAASAASSSS